MTRNPFDPSDPFSVFNDRLRDFNRLLEDPVSKLRDQLLMNDFARMIEDPYSRVQKAIEEQDAVRRALMGANYMEQMLQREQQLMKMLNPYGQIRDQMLHLSPMLNATLEMQDRIQKMLEPSAYEKELQRMLSFEDRYRNELASLDRSFGAFRTASGIINERLDSLRLHDSVLETLRAQADAVERSMLIDLAAEINEATTGDGLDEAAIEAAMATFIDRLVVYFRTTPVTEQLNHIGFIIAVLSFLLILYQAVTNPNEGLERRVDNLSEIVEEGLAKLDSECPRYRTMTEVHLRMEPTKESESITVLEPGATVLLIEDGAEWKMVTVELTGETFSGYVKAEYLELLPEVPDNN